MDVYLDDRYPADAAYGNDYFTGAAQGDVIIETPEGPVLRREKVLITSRENDYEGRVCVGERTVRHLAHMLDMVDRWRVDLLIAQLDTLGLELVTVSAELADLREQNRILRQLEERPAERIYVSVNGQHHASARAATEQSRLDLHVERAEVPAGPEQPQEVDA